MKKITESLEDIQFINEHFVTCLNKEDMKKYKDEVWEIMKRSYAYIGGVAGIKNADELVEDTDLWKLVKRNGKITAAKCYKMKKGGRKANCGGYDGTDQGKKDILKIYDEDGLMKHRKAYGEFSGKAVSTTLKAHGIPVPAIVAKEILAPKEIEICEDGWFYIRKLGDGKTHHKLMIGNLPGREYQEEEPSDELIQQLKQLAKKYYEEDEGV